jgi:hypothetical protein
MLLLQLAGPRGVDKRSRIRHAGYVDRVQVARVLNALESSSYKLSAECGSLTQVEAITSMEKMLSFALSAIIGIFHSSSSAS